jgi:hypothetical protein
MDKELKILRTYCRAVFGHWWVITIEIVLVLLDLVERAFGVWLLPPLWAKVTIGVAVLVGAQFLAYRNKPPENSMDPDAEQKPFVTPVMRPNPPDEGWGLENQGRGPAINGQLSFVQHGPQLRPFPCLAPGARYNVHNMFGAVVGNQGGIEIQYESLSGRKYRTLVTWGDAGAMHVGFEKLPA